LNLQSLLKLPYPWAPGTPFYNPKIYRWDNGFTGLINATRHADSGSVYTIDTTRPASAEGRPGIEAAQKSQSAIAHVFCDFNRISFLYAG
jgi:hypothetical protein